MIKKAEIIKNGNVNLNNLSEDPIINTATYNRLLGNFIGTLKGVCCWDIPDELKMKLERKIKELERE